MFFLSQVSHRRLLVLNQHLANVRSTSSGGLLCRFELRYFGHFLPFSKIPTQDISRCGTHDDLRRRNSHVVCNMSNGDTIELGLHVMVIPLLLCFCTALLISLIHTVIAVWRLNFSNLNFDLISFGEGSFIIFTILGSTSFMNAAWWTDRGACPFFSTLWRRFDHNELIFCNSLPYTSLLIFLYALYIVNIAVDVLHDRW